MVSLTFDTGALIALERGDIVEVASLHPLGRPDAWRLPSGAALLSVKGPP